MFRSVALLTAGFFACGDVGAQGTVQLPVPVLVLVTDFQKAPDHDAGLLGMWISHSADKAAAKRAVAFRTNLSDPGFDDRVRNAFGCFALAPPCVSPAVYEDKTAFDAAVVSSPGQTGFVVEFLAEQTPEHVVLRARARRVVRARDVAGTPIIVGAGYTAVYSTRMPKDVVGTKVLEKKAAALRDYWNEGDPRRITAVSRDGLAILNNLFALLLRDGSESGPMPAGWQALPTLPPYKSESKTARFRCTRRMCSKTHIVEDHADSVVLVGGVGNVAGWFDAAAAAHQSDVMFIANMGIFWP